MGDNNLEIRLQGIIQRFEGRITSMGTGMREDTELWNRIRR